MSTPISSLATSVTSGENVAPIAPSALSGEVSPFPTPPREPVNLAEAGLSESDVDALVLKHLLQYGNLPGKQAANHICLPRNLVGDSLERLREELLVSIKSSAGVGDYLYQLSEAGFARAQRHAARTAYVGAAPVPLTAYRAAIRHQSIQDARLGLEQLAGAFADLKIQPKILSRLAQAINDGRGMFLFGSPGNGKTTIAERICDTFGEYLWIPRMVQVGGDLIRLFDPSCHRAVDPEQFADQKYDRRWVLIRRPTVVVGGELTLDQLDASYNPTTRISEAPVHMKANGGALVIDDFGRQRVSSTDILNRLIVPLEKHFDYLNLASGRQVQVPFDMLFVLSTNLEPRDLVDEAFLRRIPYKIEVGDPTEEEFGTLLAILAQKAGFHCPKASIDYLIERHFKQKNRPLRFCQPRDLLRQIKNYCEVHDLPAEVTPDCIDMAVENYFAAIY